MNKNILISFILIFLFSHNGLTQTICESNSPESTRIYFANGMRNERWQADESAEKIRLLLNTSPSNLYRTSYNYSKNCLTQLLQAYEQQKEEQQLAVEPEEYWYWLRNMDEAPEWFQKVYQQNMQQFQESSGCNDPYLTQHVNNYPIGMYKKSKSTHIGFPIHELS